MDPDGTPVGPGDEAAYGDGRRGRKWTTFAERDAYAEPSGVAAEWESLIEAALQRKPGARDQLLAALRPHVLRYCRARMRGKESRDHSADDTAQEVCLAVVAALPTYRTKRYPFRAFVYGIAAHKVADFYRALSRDRSDPFPDIPDYASPAEEPVQTLLAEERANRLKIILGNLTTRQREILAHRLLSGLSATETADRLGTTPGAIRVTQHRALVQLRSSIESEDLELFGFPRPGDADFAHSGPDDDSPSTGLTPSARPSVS